MGDHTVLLPALIIAAVTIAVLIWIAISTVKRLRGQTKEYSAIDEPEITEEIADEPTKIKQKRGVVTDKEYEVLKDGIQIPYVEFVRAIQIASVDGTTDSCFVSEEVFNSIKIGDAVTYIKEGDRFYFSGCDENNIHEMALDAEPFEKIRDGEKTIELRLNDDKRRKVKVGDKIIFTLNGSENDYIMTRVVALHKFSSFKELYSKLPLDKCGYSNLEAKSADPNDMRRYYTAEDEAKYGVVGIEIELDMIV